MTTAVHLYCVYCGRRLVEVVEPDSLADPATGKRPPIVWRQCPRYPRNGLISMFRGTHESFQRDAPWRAREYR